VLDNGNSYEVPDFRRESSRRQWEHDTWSPLRLDDPGAPPAVSRGKREIYPEGLKVARRVWKSIGYKGT
jgi:hypothetical protein